MKLVSDTGGPRISWFLVPRGIPKCEESRNPRTLISIKPQNGSKNFLKSPFFANFHEISFFLNQNATARLILTCLLSYLTHYAHTYLLMLLLKLLKIWQMFGQTVDRYGNFAPCMSFLSLCNCFFMLHHSFVLVKQK